MTAVPSAPATPDAPSAPSAPRTDRLSISTAEDVEITRGPSERTFLLAYVAAAFGVWIATVTPAGVTLAVRIGEAAPQDYEAVYSLVAGLGAVISIPFSPIIGRLSDVSSSRFGRRRPFILAGSVLALVGALVLAWTSSTPLLLLGWAVVMIGNQVSIAPLWAVVSDRVAPRHQGLLAGLTGAMQSAAALAGTWYVSQTGSTFLMLAVPAVVGLALVLVFVFVVPEPQVRSAEKADLTATLRGLVFDPRRERGLALALLAIALLTAGSAVVGLYVYYYLQVALGQEQAAALQQVFIYSVITYVLALASAPIAGLVSDRLGRRGLVYGIAGVLSAAGILVVILTGSLAGFYVGSALLGVSTGVFSGQSIALVLSTGDTATAGRDLGLVGVAMSLPISLVPLGAPLLLGIGGGEHNYTALFSVGVVLSLLVVPVLHLAHRAPRPTH